MVSAGQSDPHHQGQCDPTLAVQKGGPVGLVAVIVFDADPRPFLRATRNQRIVDNQVDQLVWKNSLRQLQQLNGQVGDRDIRPLDQFVVGGPVRLAANGTDGTK
nr:hypothetical protein [Ferrovum myxofaciens]